MKYRTLKLVSLGVIFAVALVLGGTALGQISATTEYRVEFLADIADHPGYWVRSSEGFLSVYYKDWGHPIFISHIPIATLRSQDRTEVERGIFVATRQELMELLEDFGS